MASQYRKVTGNTSNRGSSANAILQAKIGRLPQLLAQRQRKEVLARDSAFQNSQIALQKKQQKQAQREQQSAMGLEAARLGLNIGMSDMGQKTLGDISASGQNTYNSAKSSLTNTTKPAEVMPGKGPISGINIGGALSSGLVGYGVGNLVGGKKKGKKALWGGLAGGALGMLSAPRGGSMMGGLIGTGLGTLGGYLS